VNSITANVPGFFVLVALTLDRAVIPFLHKHSLFTTVISEILKSWLMLVNSETAYTLRNAFFAIVSRFEYSKDLR